MRLVFLTLLAQCRGIYEREAGHFDWKLSFIGAPVAGGLNPRIEGGIIVSTEGCIVSTVALSSGDVVWKSKVCASPSKVLGFYAFGSGDLVVKTSNEAVVLDAENGARKWSLPMRESLSSVVLCDEGARVKFLSPSSEFVVHASDGSPAAGAHSCAVPRISSVPFPLVLNNEYELVVDAGHVFACLQRGEVLWSREEALASVSDVTIVSKPKVEKISSSSEKEQLRDLEWLMGEPRRAVLLSRKARRFVIVDISTGKVVSGITLPISKKPIGLMRKRLNDGLVELVSLGTVDPWTGVWEEVRTNEEEGGLANVEYEVDESAGEITGKSSSAGNTLWRVNLKNRIVKVVEPSNSELGNVPVLVKGDASVVFKYMNPNLLVVVSERKPGGGGIFISALDSVTGALVHQTVVPSASSEPKLLFFVQSDNWIVGHYWNRENGRFEIIAIDLYEKRQDKGFYAAATGKASPVIESAYQLPTDPIPLVQQFVFPLGPVTAVAVTGTSAGISPKQVLFATLSGVYAIRKDSWLNPRRPHAKISLPERLALAGDESLPPYTPLLPMHAGEFVSHKHVIEFVWKILTVPTHLESTCLAFAVGESEIFVAPIYPGSAPYDVLSPFFNFYLLAVSVAVVALSVIVTSVLADRKQLYNKWK